MVSEGCSNVRNLHRLIVVLVLVVAALVTASPVALGSSQLVYSDEFNGPLDASTWVNATPWNTRTPGNGELAYYDPANVTFAGGLMTLKSERRAQSGFEYTSGIVTSLARAKFSYGYFEIRAKLPGGPGIWPAFWLTNDQGFEIDALEMLGDRPSRIYMTLHENRTIVYNAIKDGPDYSAGFHTYGVDWQPTYVKWYIDGELVAGTNRAMPAGPMWICLNTAVGGSWPGAPTSATVFPVNYDIDYVRVYDTKPVPHMVVATADSYSAIVGTTLTVAPSGVLANDADTGGHALSAVMVAQPANGTLSLRSDGSFVYVPRAGYTGVDSFRYAATDGDVVSSAAIVSLNVGAVPTAVTRPVAKKKSRTRTATVYRVAGTVRLGSTGRTSGIVPASYPAAAVSPAVIKVRVQRHVKRHWRQYGVRTLRYSSAYSTLVHLRKGTYRIRTQVTGGAAPAGTSRWSKTIRVR